MDSRRVGIGYDSHRLVEGRPLVIGGVKIDHPKGLAGHSDADVLAHAVIDAILGAAALGDIGEHFPDSEERWRDSYSLDLMERAAALLNEHGWEVENVDATVIAQEPRLAPHKSAIRQKLASSLGIDAGGVSVKATTSEGMGPTGRGEGVAALAVAQIMKTEGS